MKMNRLLLLSFFMMHFTICQAHIMKATSLIATGIYLGMRYEQAEKDLNKTEELIGKDAQRACDKARLAIELVCGEQEGCQSAIKSLQACKEKIGSITNSPKK